MLVVINFDENFSSVRVIRPRELYREQGKTSSKTVLDTFFIPFYYTKNTRTDVADNYIQRFIYKDTPRFQGIKSS